MNNRIRSNHVQLGDSLIIENAGASEEKLQYEQENESKKAFDAVLKEAQNQADMIIENAQKKAAEMLKTSEETSSAKMADMENIKQQAIENGYAEGYQKGYDEGINQARQDVTDKIQAVNTLACASFKVKKEIINTAEKEIIELSAAIAEKIIRQQLEAKPELMLEIIKAAICQLSDKEEIKIIVNPSLTGALYELTETLKEEIRGLKSIKITEDKTIPVDGVIVESSDSRIDGRVNTQLSEIVRNMMSEFSQKANTDEIPESIEARINNTAAEKNKKGDSEN